MSIKGYVKDENEKLRWRRKAVGFHAHVDGRLIIADRGNVGFGTKFIFTPLGL